MKTTTPLAVFAVTTLLVSTAFVPANADSSHHPESAKAGTATAGMQRGSGAGTMPRGSGSGMMMGKGGMMGGKGSMMQGMIHKKMMGHHMGFRRAKPLSAEDVRRIVDGRLSMRGFSRLKAANVAVKDDNMAIADVVTAKGELVLKITVNRHNGMTKIVE